MPQFSMFAKKAEQIVVIDLSSRTTKAVRIRRQDERLALVDYVLLEAPEKNLTGEALGDHLRSVTKALNAAAREVIFLIGMGQSILRNIELPQGSIADLRRILKLNAKTVLQQDVSDFVFDCFIIPQTSEANPFEGLKSQKQFPVLVAGAKHQLIQDLQAAAKESGLVVCAITLSQMGMAGAAILAQPTAIQPEAVALVDLGFANSTISFLVGGVPLLTRVVSNGEEKFNSRLAEAFHAPQGATEELKPAIIQAKLQNLLAPIGQEFRAAIDYCEDLLSKRVRQGFVSGDLARSHLIVETLQDLEIPCQKLDLSNSLEIELSEGKKADLERHFPQLVNSIGAAAAWFQPDQPQVNLLAEEIEAAAAWRRDPVRLGTWAAGFVVLLLVLWAGFLKFESSRQNHQVKRYEAELVSLEKSSTEAAANSKKTAELERKLAVLEQHATNGFRWAPPLNALQQTIVPDIDLVRLKIEQSLRNVEVPASPKAAASTRKKTNCIEQITMTIVARNFAETAAEEKFIEAITSYPYFEKNLRKTDPVLLKNRLPRQVDPLDNTKTFTLFTLECFFAERVLGDE